MSIFAIADTHLSFGTDKPMDSFPGWKDYVLKIEKNWNNIVKDGDTVVIAGDISWAINFDQLFPDFEFINNLKGNKIIIKGNHDYWWSTASKMNKFISDNHFDTIKILHNNSYTADGVSICGSRGWLFLSEEDHDELLLNRELGRVRRSLEDAECDEKILFLHYPPVTTVAVCKEMIELMKEYGVKRCYYGHLHGAAANLAAEGKYDGIDFRLISCDKLKFTPLLLR